MFLLTQISICCEEPSEEFKARSASLTHPLAKTTYCCPVLRESFSSGSGLPWRSRQVYITLLSKLWSSSLLGTEKFITRKIPIIHHVTKSKLEAVERRHGLHEGDPP